MTLSSGHWYAVASSRELGMRPLAKTRFGERLVFWRDGAGRPRCLADRCAHRGAALSLGRVVAGCIECPFHGLRYDGAGRCVSVPVESLREIPPGLAVDARGVREGDGMVWIWRGPPGAEDSLPALPRLATIGELPYGEMAWTWNGHYTRCIESVIDFSHLPFVHPRSLGLFIREKACTVSVDPTDGGFRARRNFDSLDRQFIEFLYPNVWINRVGPRFFLAAIFAPVDENHTEAYLRWYYPPALRVIRPLVDAWGRFAQWLVFSDDLPVIASQVPPNVDDADGDHLLPSDATHVAYRRLRRAHQAELRDAAGS